ncbi:phosphoribosyl transferase domain protein [Lasiosphaeria hispida]|uniref:Phosphoribosyl transferase domain protein n=1 Tax=Lasiosphaeria hispida TaxID=260671 RepID=A0AAJ0HD24_9PEZI|nr:phosphoribosyl transferase domain protein [Lasiosphaeria hispida]
MATLNSLKQALKQTALTESLFSKKPLSDAQYSAGFGILAKGSAYQDFIAPQLSQLITNLLTSRTHISVLEIGPGSQTVLRHLPIRLRQKIKRYTAFEPINLFATSLEEWFRSTSSLPSLEGPPDIHQVPFTLNSNMGIYGAERFDLVLFCHSMYGMKPDHQFIEKALGVLVERPEGGIVVVFHRGGVLKFDGLMCHATASFPTGVVSVADDDEVLDCFAQFTAGFTINDTAIRVAWRGVCRTLGNRDEADPSRLWFSAPEIMVAFNRHATMLPELAALMPAGRDADMVKNRQARLHQTASTLKPTNIPQIQQCVRWALAHGASLTVLGGGHSGHCLWPNIIAVDMSAFDNVHVLTAGEDGDLDPIVIAEAGCNTGDIIRQAMTAGLTVPLGARPSVGAGLWLQGGIGHLARLHGLACDAIVGAVVVGVESGAAFCVGRVPRQHWPAGATRPENESELLWAIKGAGTNFGIVVSVTFRAFVAPTYSTRDWVIPLNDKTEARSRLGQFDELVAKKLPRNCSADAYLFWDAGQLRLGVTMFESSTTGTMINTPASTTAAEVEAVLGPAGSSATVDGVGLFESEMYMSEMHGGHGGGKTSAFKRCMFLKNIGEAAMAHELISALETRPSPFCYLHLLHGGGAVGDVVADATAFGCRDWEFACVITGVWPRDQDGAGAAQAAIRWVYAVAADLSPLCCGAYGADLGPDPRDLPFASRAFGPNRSRLARLKHNFDPQNVLAYACPLPRAAEEQRSGRVIVVVTGESCAGKDYCAATWVSLFTEQHLTARAVSISDTTKREYAVATGADLDRLLGDRAYKEQHRPALTAFFQEQVKRRPRLPEEHFLHVVNSATDVDVLFITGMRDEAPVATFSHLLPDSRLLEVRIEAGEAMRQTRRGCRGVDDTADLNGNSGNTGSSNAAGSDHRPSFIFQNDTTGTGAAKCFAGKHLLPFFHEELKQLAKMVSSAPDFPRPGIEFRHVLNIAQQPGGLALCASLLRAHFTGEWAKIDAVVCCEAGGYVFASALALVVNVPLVLIREGGKLPPPIVAVVKSPSHISSSGLSSGSGEKSIEMGRDMIPRGSSVVVVDDVLATGRTLCAMLQLLGEAGVKAEDVSVMAVAEFPVHRGRELLRRRSFGKVNIQSLLVFGGV